MHTYDHEVIHVDWHSLAGLKMGFSSWLDDLWLVVRPCAEEYVCT